MLHIYTEEFFFRNRLKGLVKKILGRYARGPQGVAYSLQKGLQALQTEYEVNHIPSGTLAVAGVLSGVGTLSWAIEQKKAGRLGKLFAGPNLVVSPKDHNRILTSPFIDKVIVPSAWVAEAYAAEAPELANKIVVWPAGVDVPELGRGEKTIDFLIYNKISHLPLAQEIASFLATQNYTYKIVSYNSFTQQEYFRLLDQAKYLVYLSETESQGLGMFEAWARNIPVFAYEPGRVQRPGYMLTGNIATPYVTPELGMRFNSLSQFVENLPGFISTKFSPHAYMQNNFSHAKAAKKYLDILYA